ncbi:hypothetical protein GCM10023149_28100 [Mucilaginibacter gynuensis]|uniref:DUF2490 domain-containing protein n=1 Tax=Mucilaginibacter gynuensis TaxID=1302236 RepID=A0ABP8GJQ0_9SPHI
MKISLKLFLLALTLFVSSGKLFAQSTQYSLWGAWFYNQKLSEHWGVGGDVQFRSANHADYLRNILIRPQVNYYFNKNKFASAGYAYIATHGRTATDDKTFRPEHRSWEQFTLVHKVGANTAVSHRFRLEQRYMGNTTNRNDSYFSQRFRYFVRAVVPFKKDSVFTKGHFLALQNEVFANVQNKHKVNNHFFDQNRAYVAFGYRLNKGLDIEAGYLNQYTKQATSGVTNHVLQAVLYTRF